MQTHKPDNHDASTNNGSGRLPECSRCREGGYLPPQRAALKDRAAASLETLAGTPHRPSCSRRAENKGRGPSTEIRLGVLLGVYEPKVYEPKRPPPEPNLRLLHSCERGPPGS